MSFFNCCCTPATCNTGLTVDFYNFDGTKNFCAGVGAITWSISGTSTADNKSISLTGNTTAPYPTYRFSLGFNGTQLPAGNYTLSFVEKAAICGASTPQDNGRFTPTSFPFTVVCPSTTKSFTTTANWDLIRATSTFGINACDIYYPDVAYNAKLTVTASIQGPATECDRQVLPYYNFNSIAGNIICQFKITGYPFSVRFDASGENCLPADDTYTYTACNNYSNQWRSNPRVWWKTYRVGAATCQPAFGVGNFFALPNATVIATGGITGTGTTTANDAYHPGVQPGIMTLTDFVQDKKGVDSALLVINWTVTHPRTLGASYNSTDYGNNINDAGPGNAYGGTLCAMGGYAGQARVNDYGCGGCNEPLSGTLIFHGLGETCNLKYDGRYGVWSGSFTKQLMSKTCADDKGNVHNAVGPVTFQVIFQGVRPLSVSVPYLAGTYCAVFYSSGYGSQPSHCSGYVSYKDAISNGNSYGASNKGFCEPFLGTIDGTWTYWLYREDGSGLADEYSVPINITIMEA